MFLLLLAGLVSAQDSTPNYSKLVVFGDSLSDTGNLAIFNFPYPYYNNRISDGPLIVDALAEVVGVSAQASGHLLGRTEGFNYAVAGGNIVGDDREDLRQQVTAYLQRENGQADPDALYLVFAGGNDVRGLRSLVLASEADTQIASAITELSSQVTRLKNAGARAFLIPNVANIGRLPETLSREAMAPGTIDRATRYSRAYNAALAYRLAQFRADSSFSIETFDFFQAVESLILNAASLGFTNVEEGCFDADEFEVATECLLFGFGRRVFFDSLHPSAASNRIVGAQLSASLPRLESAPEYSPVITPSIQLLLLSD